MAEAPGRRPVSVRSVNCPNCGAATAVRTFGHAVNVVCQSCGSILDAANPGVTILQQYTEAVRVEPLIPLGTRGKLLDIECEVVGFQVRQIVVDDVAYQWREYLLFNPYREFRYLTEYAGHWNVVSTINALPEGGATPDGGSARSYGRQKYRHFQTADATTTFVLGEFPWQIRVGDTTTGSDYVAPPLMLSAEVDADKEVTWSLGRYVRGDEIWASLSLPGKPPRPVGIFANQPSPFRGVTGTMWRNAALLVALAALLWVAHLASARGKQAFAQNYVFDPSEAPEASAGHAGLRARWPADGRCRSRRRRTSTTSGCSSATRWSTTRRDRRSKSRARCPITTASKTASRGPKGRRPTPWRCQAFRPAATFSGSRPKAIGRHRQPMRYRVRVVRDVSTSLWFMVALVLIAVPPILASWRAAMFERRRWQESDHG